MDHAPTTIRDIIAEARRTKRIAERKISLLSRVTEDANGCWLWHKIGPEGYSTSATGLRRHATSAHIAVYEVFKGRVPDGLVLDHTCRVRHCVNPAHLEPVTQKENLRRGKLGILRGK